MKKLFFLVLVFFLPFSILKSQNFTMNDYSKQWSQVEYNLTIKQLPQTALKILSDIEISATKENNDAQLVKVAIYRARIKQEYEENSLKNTIYSFDSLAKISFFPVKNVYLSLLAELYDEYYSDNEYKINTNVAVIDKSNDIDMWSRDDFKNTSYEYYLQSIDNEKKLQSISIEQFDVILNVDSLARKLQIRPTLYDFLAFRAISFFSDADNNLLGDKFISDKALAPYNVFLQLDIDSTVTTSEYLLQSLKLYQNIMKLHNSDIVAFIDADLHRLDFVHSNLESDNSDDDYLTSLFSIERRFSKHPSCADIMFKIASYYYSKAGEYDREISDKYNDYYIFAADYCKKVVNQFPNTNSGRACSSLLEIISNSEVGGTDYNRFCYPDEYFTFAVKYKNCNHLYFKIVKLNYDECFFPSRLYSEQELREMYFSNEVVSKWDIDVEDPGDYREHSVEVAASPLHYGTYAIIISDDKNFNYVKDYISYFVIQVTDINVIATRNANDDYEIVTVDRNSGKILKNCKVNIYCYTDTYKSEHTYRKYNMSTYLNVDKDGKCVIAANSLKKEYYLLEISSGNGHKYYIGNDIRLSNYDYYRRDNNSERFSTRFYLDRAIYRPGQTVLFKGIVMSSHTSKNNTTNEIAVGKSVQVILKNVNYENVSEVNLVTDDFGSFAGSFIIPAKGLTGDYSIFCDCGGNINFKVEEYKRPTFENSFENTTPQAKINSNVSIKLKSESYSGVPLANVTVKYVVTRTVSWWFWWLRNANNYGNAVKISSGETSTDENGNAIINFVAKCPDNQHYFYKPIYHFNVNVDVTDASGETISDSYSLNISEQSIAIRCNVNDILDISKDTLIFSATNVDSKNVDAKFDVIVTRIQPPIKTYRDRLWDTPDYYMFTKDQYEKHFPKDIVGSLEMSSWNKIKSSEYHLVTNGKIDLSDNKVFSVGYYSLTVSTIDSYGAKVVDSFCFQIVDTQKNKFGIPFSGIKVITDKDKGYVDDTLNVFVISSSDDAMVRINVSSHGRTIVDELTNISGIKHYNFGIGDEDRGGITINVFSTFDNRDYHVSTIIEVPFDNKDITLKLLTERNFLMPGGTEKWTVKLTNNKGKNIVAEMLATMYDMSLDQFVSQQYILPSWGNVYNNSRIEFIRKQIEDMFSYGNTDKQLSYYSYSGYSYDMINWFGLMDNDYRSMFGNYSYGNKRGRALFSKASVSNVDDNAVNLMTVSGEVQNTALDGEQSQDAVSSSNSSQSENKKTVQKSIRRDFRETAFFYPQLKTDADGNISFDFVVPESITRWKFRALAHTKDLSSGLFENEIITKKDIYISANYPKVLYQGDTIEYSAKISNFADKMLTGKSIINIKDINGNDITGKVVLNKDMNFSILSKNSSVVRWTVNVPDNTSVLIIRVEAETDNFADAEEHIIPVLTNKVLITETLPITIKESGRNVFTFKSFNERYGNNDYKTKSVTLEYAPNAVWYAVQALPYFDDIDDNISDVVLGKLYANYIAGYVVDNNAAIEEIYKKIKVSNPEEFISQLEKNQELKNVLIAETPWILDAKNEHDQREKMILLFDYNQMKYNKSQSINKLAAMQMSDGAFPWIKGCKYPSYYSTLYIVYGFTHLQKLGIIDIAKENQIKNIVRSAITYLDSEIVKDYQYLKRYKLLDNYTITSNKVLYLYLRNGLSNVIGMANEETKTAYDYYISKVETQWTKQTLSMQAVCATLMQNLSHHDIAIDIIKSFNERALHSDELGMYWRDLMSNNYFDMFNSPEGIMSLMIECYHNITSDNESIAEMKRWLLNQKRTTMWRTNDATIDAIYALLLGSSPKIISEYKNDMITIGNEKVAMDQSVPGSGYVKQTWTAEEIDKNFGNILINKTEDGTAWGSVYWQYITDYNNVKSSSSGLSVERIIMKASYKNGKTEYTEVKSGEVICRTDKVVVRMIIKADRNMEYIHLKDMLPACFIPEEILSGYHYCGNIFYYCSIHDESINYFIDRLNKGEYIIEYKVNVQQMGTFNAGFSKIQCYYAPEFGGQSEGIRISVK